MVYSVHRFVDPLIRIAPLRLAYAVPPPAAYSASYLWPGGRDPRLPWLSRERHRRAARTAAVGCPGAGRPQGGRPEGDPPDVKRDAVHTRAPPTGNSRAAHRSARGRGRNRSLLRPYD